MGGIKGGVGWDYIADHTPDWRMHGWAEGVDHARRYAGLESKWVANGDHNLTDPQIFRISQTHVDKLRPVDADNREVSIRIVPNGSSRILAAVLQVHRDLSRVVHDVAVRQNETIRSDDET